MDDLNRVRAASIEGAGSSLLRWWGSELFHDNLALGIDGPDIPQNAAVLEIHDHKSLRPMTPVSNLSSGNIRISLRPSVARHKPDEQGKASEPQCAH